MPAAPLLLPAELSQGDTAAVNVCSSLAKQKAVQQRQLLNAA